MRCARTAAGGGATYVHDGAPPARRRCGGAVAAATPPPRPKKRAVTDAAVVVSVTADASDAQDSDADTLPAARPAGLAPPERCALHVWCTHPAAGSLSESSLRTATLIPDGRRARVADGGGAMASAAAASPGMPGRPLRIIAAANSLSCGLGSGGAAAASDDDELGGVASSA